MPDTKMLRPDAKGCLNIGIFKQDASVYEATINSAGVIQLIPYSEIPKRDLDLLKNPALVKEIREAQEAACDGDLHDLGSFSQYID